LLLWLVKKHYSTIGKTSRRHVNNDGADLLIYVLVFWICNFVFRFVNFVPKSKSPKKY
jgi:hypothetical protein